MITEKKIFVVPELEGQKRLDIFLVEHLQLSRGEIQKMIKNNKVQVNGKLPKKAGDMIRQGDAIDVYFIEEEPVEVSQEDLELYKKIEIIADETDYIVINKPAGLLVHPTQADEPATLAHWLVQKYPGIRGVGENAERPGIVHRLDREASGLMVVAKNQKAFEHLKAQFKQREVEKFYTVLVHGVVEAQHDTLDFEIDRGNDGRMVSRPKTDKLALDKVYKRQPGKTALTEFWVEKVFVNFTLLKVKIHTGRTHQIRVHMYAYNHHVVGDELYHQHRGRKYDKQLGRLFLHAQRLVFQNTQGESVDYELKLPKELSLFLQTLK
ncbi:RluA family pseudouridine synthase [Candidatus Nomurabacteria bacterium]|nr:RluA family pseudouridine synthase [Candidatus Nomurabacteria bacterium]